MLFRSAAAITVSSGSTLLISTDALVEGVHFDLKYFSFHDIGWRSAAVNISDIAAMGGKPIALLASLGLPQGITKKNIADLYSGIRKISDRFGVEVAGGDTVRSKKGVFISVTVTGEGKKNSIVKRSGAQPGDIIIVLGLLGGSAAGMRLLKKHRRSKGRLCQKHLRPMPMVNEGLLIGSSGLATSMIDNSDGLAKSVYEICSASSCGANLFDSEIPVENGATFDEALFGGEDYGLILTCSPGNLDALTKLLMPLNVKLSLVGEITKPGKKAKKYEPKGFKHF